MQTGSFVSNLHRRDRSARRGFTLLELLTVIGILTIFISLLSVAVSRVRESGRKLQCQNNLHQLGIALANFETHQHRYPGVLESLPLGKKEPLVGLSGYVALLPELEVKFEFEEVGRKLKVGRMDGDYELPPSVLTCPSSGPRLGYRLNVGATDESISPLVEDGFFRTYPPLRASEITDGLSNTVAMSERMAIDESQRMPAGAAFPGNLFSQSNFASRCARAANRRRIFADPGDKFPWWEPMGLSVMYDHSQTPNGPAMDCHGGSTLTGTFIIMNVMTARSYHSGGVNVLAADGAVHWVANSVDLLLWKAAATPNGNQNSELPW